MTVDETPVERDAGGRKSAPSSRPRRAAVAPLPSLAWPRGHPAASPPAVAPPKARAVRRLKTRRPMRSIALVAALSLACSHAAPRAASPAPPEPPAAAPVAAARVPYAPFAEPPEPEAPDDHLREPADAAEVCVAADSNLTRDLAAVLALPAPAGSPPPRAPWDRRTPPAGLDLVSRRLNLRPADRALLARNGFVVPARLTAGTYAWAFHEVYQSQLPLYVSADAILHAVYVTHDRLVADAESRRLAPALTEALDAMHAALPAASRAYPPAAARDLDLYLTVARSLLRGAPVAASADVRAEADALVARIHAAEGVGEVPLFGRTRAIDFSQYQPRGHYTPEGLARFFRGAMWLSRLEFNVVTRACRSSDPEGDSAETPREALDALCLADLAERAAVAAPLDRVERAWEALAGRREDLSRADLTALRARAGITSLRDDDAFERLRAAIGAGYRRTARLHPMHEGCGELPVIATLLGPRITADTAALRPLAHGEVEGRHRVGVTDVAYVLGHDRARALMPDELARFPALGAQLDVARGVLAGAPPDRSLYGAWLGAIRGLAARHEGVVPSFEATDAFADLRVNSAVAAYAQLRHNHVLIAGQAYDEGGCVIPDAWVEPAPAVWDALLAYTDRARDALDALGEPAGSDADRWLTRTAGVLRGLRAITAMELANRPLPVEARRWLAMVVEMRPGSSDGPPTYSGWYFDLFRRRQDEGLTDASLIADYFTAWDEGNVFYAGVTRPRLGVFVVDVAGAPRVMVGPVAAAYGHVGSVARRLDDDASRELPPSAMERPWAASYEVAAPGAPPLAASYETGDEEGARGPSLTLRSARALGAVTVELLDHHRVLIRSVVTPVGARARRVSLRGPRACEAVRLRVGAWDAVVALPAMGGAFSFGEAPAPHARE
jgi:hypothetical protein